jgi:hypothetical protein
VKKASEYREHADECRQMAARTQNDEHKAMLAKMAETWEALALEREAKMARDKRMAVLDAPAINK